MHEKAYNTENLKDLEIYGVGASKIINHEQHAFVQAIRVAD
jgi:hypothetical protein